MSLSKKKIRAAWRLAIFKRDFHQCKKCNPNAKRNLESFCYGDFDAHHIIDRSLSENGGYTLDNGITLCKSCHLKAERFHQTNQQTWHAGYHPSDLFNLISK